MKTLVTIALIVLALCVSQATTAHSQITLTRAEGIALISRLDTLSYLRAGHAQLLEMNANLELQCYQRDTIIYLQDTTIQALKRRDRETVELLSGARAAESKWRGFALGAGGSALLSIAALTLVLLAR